MLRFNKDLWDARIIHTIRTEEEKKRAAEREQEARRKAQEEELV
jgi:hypothetical protein